VDGCYRPLSRAAGSPIRGFRARAMQELVSYVLTSRCLLVVGLPTEPLSRGLAAVRLAAR
jgi:hypothetical protein